MQQTSSNYKNEIKQPSRFFECRVTIGRNIYTNENIVDIILDYPQSVDGFSIGNTTSQSLDLTLLNTGEEIYSTNQIKVEIGLKVGSSFEYILMGYYNVDEVSKNDYTIKFTAFDNMMKFETPYFSNLGDKPTLQQIANELASITGVEFEGSLPNYSVTKVDGYTCREMLSYIASLCGGNALITREGKFTIKTSQSVDYSIIPENHFGLTTEEVSYKLGKITCLVDEETELSKGATGIDSMELSFENPLMTESIMNDLYNQLNGFTYLGYQAKWQGDLSLDPYDLITIQDKNGTSYEVPILNQKFTYTGGLTSEISAKGESKNKNSFSSSGPTANKVNRMVTEQAVIKEALINKANIQDLEAVSIRTQTLEATTAKIQDAIIDVAYVKDLNAVNAQIETLKVADANIQNAMITKADIHDLNAAVADIGILNADLATIKHLVNGNLSSENIQAGGITSDKLTIANGFIKDAMIDSLNANKITAGQINTALVQVSSASGNLVINDNTIQIRDVNRVRVQIGKDASNDYSMSVWDSSGQLMFDARGLKANAIKDSIIRNDMISTDANIDGSKLNISSVVSTINNSSSTLKASKVQFDGIAQTLEVAFNALKTQADATKTQTESNTTAISVAQGQIKTLIQDTTITTSIGSTKLKDAYSKLEQTVGSLSSTIGSQQTIIDDHTGKITSTNSELSTLKQSVNGLSASISSAQTTINSHTTLINQKADLTAVNDKINSAKNELNTSINKKANAVDVYNKTETYTKAQTDSAIKVAKDEINLGVSSTYATKTDVTSSINGVNSSISNLQNRMNSAEQKITDSAIVSTVTNSSSWQTQTSNLNSALNKLSINEQTKMNGLELLPQGYLTNDSKGYKVDYNVAKWQNNRIEVTGREWIRTDFIKFDRSKPLYWYINASCSSNNLFYFGIERFDKNKLTINGEANNATYYLVSGTNFNGEREGYWQETDTSTAYIRLRILCDWNNTGTATTTIKSIKWKQLGASITDDLATRMSTAESKITDTAITNVVKQNFYTKTETDKQITSKGYQTSSQVQQTVDNLQIKFSQSGGYNLIRNSTGYNETNLWTGTATLGTSTNTAIGSACDKFMYLDNGTTTSAQFAYSSRFKLKPSTTYTLTGWFHNYTKCPSFGVYVLSSTSVDSSNTGLSYTHVHHLIQAQNTNGSWKKYTVSFTTPSGCKSGFVRIDNNGYNANGSNSNRIHWSALILTEGALEVPWSPHPDEVYDGLTFIDKEGITVTASNVRSKTKMSADGFQLIRTTDNKKMFYVNQDGSLEMSGNFTQYDTNGKISIKIANNSYGCYDWLWDGDFVGNLGAFESNRTNTSGANQRFIGIANIADYGNQLVLGVRSSPNSTNFNTYIEIDNTSIMHRDYVTFTASTGFKSNAIFRNPSNNNNETGRIFGATNDHFYVACNHHNQLRLGYEKNGTYYSAMSIYRNDNTSAGCAIEYYADEVHHNNVLIEGFLSVKGQKNRLVATENFGDRLLNAYETAECYFGDINEAVIGEDGEVKVELDEVFLETVNTTEAYQVFLAKYGEGDCYVSERHEKYFVIKGTPNLSVGFEIKAKQRGYEKERLKMTVNTLKPHQAMPYSPCSEDEAGYTIDCETTINRA